MFADVKCQVITSFFILLSVSVTIVESQDGILVRQQIDNEDNNYKVKCANEGEFCYLEEKREGDCLNGSFRLNTFDDCSPWLGCEHLKHVEILHQIGNGAVKQVFLGLWQNKRVAVSKPSLSIDGKTLYEDDFRHGLRMLIQLGPSDKVTKLVGYCWDPLVIITEYHAHGSLSNWKKVLESQNADSSRIRFRLCVDYVQVLSFLHSSPAGVRVMCDSSDLEKTLQQYLLTKDLRILLNDVDALPRVNHQEGKLIKCGHRQLRGSFVAPEQKWPFPNEEFEDELMPLYDEKSDVWKIPDVANHKTQSTVLPLSKF